MPKPKTTFAASFGVRKATDPAALASPEAPRPEPPATPGGTKNIHVRIDVDRWIKLRTYSMHAGKTVQQILSDYIDELTDPAR